LLRQRKPFVNSQTLPIMNDSPLRQHIVARIRAKPQQRVTFATFMDWALYEPELGYYSAPRQKIGRGGDFVTAPHLSADFGELLAEQFLDFWVSLDQPAVFQIVEMGAGQGLIAGDVLRYIYRQKQEPHYAAFWNVLQYRIIEKSASAIREQQHQLQRFQAMEQKLAWCDWSEILDDSVTGCFFSNELVDAFSVHRIVMQSGRFQEVYVTVDAAGHFQEVIDDCSTPELLAYIQNLGLDVSAYPEGYHSEINLAALNWLETVAQKLHRGYVLTIDYGHTAAQYYSPQRHQGTLQCYYQQSHHDDPYWAVGQQDITAHVNFTALEQQGQRCQLRTIALIPQGLLLMALGLGDRLSANAARTDINITEILQRREALHGLANPLGLGSFNVLLQGKNTVPTLAQYPFKGFAQAPW
jgi:SAM-dependent MidA family methyltransferase